MNATQTKEREMKDKCEICRRPVKEYADVGGYPRLCPQCSWTNAKRQAAIDSLNAEDDQRAYECDHYYRYNEFD